MLRSIVISLLFMGILSSCAPRTQGAVQGVTVSPVLVKLSESATQGETVTIQGRYLGGPSTGTLWLGAEADGKNAIELPKSAVVSWTDTNIVVGIPGNFPPGGSWLFVKTGQMLSNGLFFSVKQK